MRSLRVAAAAIQFALGFVSAAAPGSAQAQSDYPPRPIRIVVPSSAGGTQDTLARLIRDGKLLPLVVATERRTPLLPEVPAAPEVLPSWGHDGSQGILAPGRTPRAIVHLLYKKVARILDLPEVKDRLQAVDFNVLTSTPEQFDRSLRSDIEVFSKVAKSAGLIAK